MVQAQNIRRNQGDRKGAHSINLSGTGCTTKVKVVSQLLRWRPGTAEIDRCSGVTPESDDLDGPTDGFQGIARETEVMLGTIVGNKPDEVSNRMGRPCSLLF